MIVRSFTVFCLLTLVYSMFVGAMPIRNYEPLNQNHGNIIAEQEFLFDKSGTADRLIVGSSLAYRMRNSMLPDNYWNLSRAGGSPFQGLQLIEQAGSKPNLVLIEINVLDREHHGGATEVNPVDMFVKRALPITQKKYQPVAYALNLGYQFLQADRFRQSGPVGGRAMEAMERLQLQLYSVDLTEDAGFVATLNQLEKVASRLRKDNVRVVFFEMPVSPRLADLARARSIRQMVRKRFPEPEYRHLDLPDCGNFQTTDGVHLDVESAQRMFEYLDRQFQLTQSVDHNGSAK